MHLKANWKLIRGVALVWGTFCIIFIWVVVIHFYLKSCNFMCFECFVVRNHVNRQIKTSHEGSRIWRLKTMVLRRFLMTIHSEENSFQVPIHCKKEERAEKKSRKHLKSHLRGCLMRPAHRNGQGVLFA